MTTWPRVPLGEVLQLQRRWIKLHPTETYREIGIRSFGKGIFHKAPIAGITLGNKRVLRIEPGDLVFNNVFAWEGAVAVAGPEEAGMIGSHRFITYTVNPTKSTAEFLKLFFATPSGRELLLKASPGSAGRNKTLGLDRFISQSIPLPPLAEQRRVVARIEGLAAQIHEARTLRQQANDEAAAFVASRVSQIFREGARHGWLAGVLGDYVADDCYGTSEKTSDDDTGTPVLRMGNIQNGRLDFRDLKYLHLSEKEGEKLFLRRGDILVNRTNSAELVGKSAVFEGDDEFSFASYLIRLRLDNERAEPRLVTAYINSPIGRAYMLSEKKQMTGQANVNSTKLKALPVALPPLAEQRRIVAGWTPCKRKWTR